MSDHEQIPLAGVIGDPIAHSKSPALHGHWLSRYGISGYYVPIRVSPADLDTVLQALPRMGFKGVNVTIPHKQAVLSLAATISERASAIGAANTLTFNADGSISAENTDGIGFIESLRQGDPNWHPDQALVLGAGGASCAVVAALLESGVKRVYVSNRTRARADELGCRFGAAVSVVDWDRVGDVLNEAGLVVNTTSLGMVGQPELVLPYDRLRRDATVMDLVYSPLETPLLGEARARGCRVVDGLGMLLHQAVPGFECWFGRRPEVDDDLRAAVLS